MLFGNPSRPCLLVDTGFRSHWKKSALPWIYALPLSVLLPKKSHPSSQDPSAVSDGPCISGFSANINATPFRRANTINNENNRSLCQSNDATSGAHQDCRNCESSMASNCHPITPSAGTTTSTRNRRRQHTRTRLDGGHWPPSHPTAASRPAQHHQRKEASRNSATEKKKNDNEFHTLQPALSPAGTSLMKRD